MTIRDQVKAELDRVDDEYLDIVRRMVESLERPLLPSGETGQGWTDFVSSTYGSLAEAPIERGEPLVLEMREPLR